MTVSENVRVIRPTFRSMEYSSRYGRVVSFVNSLTIVALLVSMETTGLSSISSMKADVMERNVVSLSVAIGTALRSSKSVFRSSTVTVVLSLDVST